MLGNCKAGFGKLRFFVPIGLILKEAHYEILIAKQDVICNGGNRFF
jgi:hypothetical protein